MLNGEILKIEQEIAAAKPTIPSAAEEKTNGQTTTKPRVEIHE